jgi:hypothetical protein
MKKAIIIFGSLLYCYCVTAYAGTSHSKNSSTEDWSMCLCSRGADAVTKDTLKITLAQARELVMASLTPLERNAPGVGIELPDKGPNDMVSYQVSDKPRFLLFHVTWNATEGSDLIGWYAVDIYTGDVFNAVSGCDEHHNKKLTNLQKKFSIPYI